MEWVVSLVEGADIEEVTDDMLEKMIVKEEKLSVLFYEENEEESNKVRYVHKFQFSKIWLLKGF